MNIYDHDAFHACERLICSYEMVIVVPPEIRTHDLLSGNIKCVSTAMIYGTTLIRNEDFIKYKTSLGYTAEAR